MKTTKNNSQREVFKAVGAFVLSGVVWFGLPAFVHAQSTAPIFTSTPTGNASGVIIVDQSSGAVTYCASYVYTLSSTTTAPIPNDSCTLLGRATPTPGSSTSLLVTASGNTVFIVNNISGQILQCATLVNTTGITGKPVGACISLGTANR